MVSLNSPEKNTISSSPFIDGKYQSKIHISIYQKAPISTTFVKVVGERVSLQTFQNGFYEVLKKHFGEIVEKHTNEFQDMKEIFGNAIVRKNYGNLKAQSDDEVQKRIFFNAQRAFEGNPFTAFAAIDNTTRKIIGFVSLGSGYEKGESQSALILNPNYKGKKYGKEIALLAGSLAYVYYLNSFEVGPKNNKAPIERFTASVLNSNLEGIQFIQKFGMKYLRSLKPCESFSTSPSSLYGINSKELEDNLKEFISLKNISWEVLRSSN